MVGLLVAEVASVVVTAEVAAEVVSAEDAVRPVAPPAVGLEEAEVVEAAASPVRRRLRR